MKSYDGHENQTGFAFLLVFILLAMGILTGGYLAYDNYGRNSRAQSERQLSAIAELKVDQLVQYRNERLGDGSVLFKNPAFSNLVRRYIERTNYADAQRRLQIWLDKICAASQYDRVFLLDSHGVARISSAGRLEPVSVVTRERASEVLLSGKIQFQDFYRDELNQKIYLAVLVPIFDDSIYSHKLGVVVLRIDPDIYLFPFIQTWPVPSRTSETLIARRDGNDVLFLNELRFQKNLALKLRFPISDEQDPAVKAVLGQKGIVEGVDYRGVPVMACVQPVPDSPWFVVACRDRSEVYGPLSAQVWLILILVIALIATAGAIVALLWRRQRNLFYREHYESAEALRDSEGRYRRLFEAAKDGILILDAETGKIVDVNPFLVEMLGYSREQFVEKAIWEIGCFKDIARNRDKFLTLKQNEFVRYDDLPLETAGGRQINVEFVSNVYTVDHHKIIQCNVRDITELRRAQEILERYKLLSQYSHDIILFIRVSDGQIVEANKAAQQAYGYDGEELLKKSIRDLRSPDSMNDITEQLQEANLRGMSFETFHRRRDGSTFPVEVSSRAMTIGEERILLSIIRDISERKSLEEKTDYLSAIVQSSEDAIIGKNLDGIITSWNKGAEMLLGFTESEVIGKSVTLLVPPELKDEESRVLDRIRLGERVEHYEAVRKSKDGREIPMSITISPIQDHEGKVVAASSIGRDITERKRRELRASALLELSERSRRALLSILEDEKRAEEEIKNLNAALEQRVLDRTAQLEASNKELEAFSYSVSHDLRAPLRSIDGFSLAMLEDYAPKLDDQAKDYLNRLRGAAQSMAGLIDDLLDLSRVTRREMHTDSVDMSPVAAEIIRRLSEAEPDRDVEFTVMPDLIASGDSHLLGVVLQNLLGNAWKFTSRKLAAKIEFGMMQKSGETIFFVHDNGAGFDAKYTAKLFAPFQRLHTPSEFPGTGIGLATVRRIVLRHGGRVWAEGQVDQGATIYFTLPIEEKQ